MHFLLPTSCQPPWSSHVPSVQLSWRVPLHGVWLSVRHKWGARQGITEPDAPRRGPRNLWWKESSLLIAEERKWPRTSRHRQLLLATYGPETFPKHLKSRSRLGSGVLMPFFVANICKHNGLLLQMTRNDQPQNQKNTPKAAGPRLCRFHLAISGWAPKAYLFLLPGGPKNVSGNWGPCAPRKGWKCLDAFKKLFNPPPSSWSCTGPSDLQRLHSTWMSGQWF